MESLGKYHVLREIGRGAMGIVYLGHDPFFDRPVALKVANPISFHDKRQGEVFRTLFFNEMRAAGMLHHPNIVEIYDAGLEDGRYYIAMEYVSAGRTLEPYCQGEYLLPVDKVAEIVFKCAQALDYAHRRGIIHRDVKPGNILVGEDAEIKVSDFSVALFTDPSVVDTQLMEPVGSPLYMAPEQLKEEAVTNQSDLYSLGVVLYELVTGRHPFSADSLAALTHRVLNDPIPLLTQYRPDVPDSLQKIVLRALAKEPGHRYPEALELAADLSQVFSALKQPRADLTTEGRVDVLRHLEFFENFRDAEIWELLRWAVWEDYATGESIIREGQEGDSLYIVVRGAVSVRKGATQVTTLKAGECFGEIGYLARRKRSATVLAATDVSVLRMNSTLLERASVHCQVQFQRILIATLIERLVHTTEMLARIEQQ